MTLLPATLPALTFAAASATVIARQPDIFVLDSSALIAHISLEPGHLIVGRLLIDTQLACLVHSVNFVEVAYHVERTAGSASRDTALEALAADGVTEKRTLSAAFVRRVSSLKTRHRIALGDAFGLALALQNGGAFVTADRHELAALCGLYPIRFIR